MRNCKMQKRSLIHCEIIKCKAINECDPQSVDKHVETNDEMTKSRRRMMNDENRNSNIRINDTIVID